jgi:hypothetical protein
LDCPLPKWCPAVALSHQDGRHSAVALLLKAALIQVSDYRLLGASGFNVCLFVCLMVFNATFNNISLFSMVLLCFHVYQSVKTVSLGFMF